MSYRRSSVGLGGSGRGVGDEELEEREEDLSDGEGSFHCYVDFDWRSWRRLDELGGSLQEIG